MILAMLLLRLMMIKEFRHTKWLQMFWLQFSLGTSSQGSTVTSLHSSLGTSLHTSTDLSLHLSLATSLHTSLGTSTHFSLGTSLHSSWDILTHFMGDLLVNNLRNILADISGDSHAVLNLPHPDLRSSSAPGPAPRGPQSINDSIFSNYLIAATKGDHNLLTVLGAPGLLHQVLALQVPDLAGGPGGRAQPVPADGQA